jgi:DNA-binding IclR family transcriptional regulator
LPGQDRRAAKLAGLPISTAHRLATELTSWRLLERTAAGLYRAGLPLRTIGARNACPPSVAERAPYVLEDLAAATHSRARLGLMTDLHVSYIEKHPGRKPATTFAAAATLPSHATALGRALLAYGPKSTVDLVIASGLRPYTSTTVTAPDRLRRALAVVRLTGVAVTPRELEPRTCAIAMPVFGPGGQIGRRDRARHARSHHRAAARRDRAKIASRSLSRELAAAAPRTTDAALTDPPVRS